MTIIIIFAAWFLCLYYEDKQIDKLRKELSLNIDYETESSKIKLKLKSKTLVLLI